MTPITEEWLKSKQFTIIPNDDLVPTYSYGPIYLEYWTDHWRCQVGGISNWWEMMKDGSQEEVEALLRIFQ